MPYKKTLRTWCLLGALSIWNADGYAVERGCYYGPGII